MTFEEYKDLKVGDKVTLIKGEDAGRCFIVQWKDDIFGHDNTFDYYCLLRTADGKLISQSGAWSNNRVTSLLLKHYSQIKRYEDKPYLKKPGTNRFCDIVSSEAAKGIMEYCNGRNYKCRTCRYGIEKVKPDHSSYATCIFVTCPCDWEGWHTKEDIYGD